MEALNASMIYSALGYGLLLSVVLVGVMIVSVAIAPDMWVGDYPPDIRERYGAMSERARKYRPLIALLFFGSMVSIVWLALGALRGAASGAPSFLDYFVTSYLVLFVFNVIDLLLLDCLLFVAIQPKWIVLAGTEGLAGYRDYGFHFRGFLKGLIFCAVMAAILSAIAYAL